jgi:hypothetical protein
LPLYDRIGPIPNLSSIFTKVKYVLNLSASKLADSFHQPNSPELCGQIVIVCATIQTYVTKVFKRQLVYLYSASFEYIKMQTQFQYQDVPCYTAIGGLVCIDMVNQN